MDSFSLTHHLKDTAHMGSPLGSTPPTDWVTLYLLRVFVDPPSSCCEFGLVPILCYFTELLDQTSGPKYVSHPGLIFLLAKSKVTRSKVKSKSLLSHLRGLRAGKQIRVDLPHCLNRRATMLPRLNYPACVDEDLH